MFSIFKTKKKEYLEARKDKYNTIANNLLSCLIQNNIFMKEISIAKRLVEDTFKAIPDKEMADLDLDVALFYTLTATAYSAADDNDINLADNLMEICPIYMRKVQVKSPENYKRIEIKMIDASVQMMQHVLKLSNSRLS